MERHSKPCLIVIVHIERFGARDIGLMAQIPAGYLTPRGEIKSFWIWIYPDMEKKRGTVQCKQLRQPHNTLKYNLKKPVHTKKASVCQVVASWVFSNSLDLQCDSVITVFNSNAECFCCFTVSVASLTSNYCKTCWVKQLWILLHQNYERSHHISLSSDFLSSLNAPLDDGKLSVLPTIHLSAGLIITTPGAFKNASDWQSVTGVWLFEESADWVRAKLVVGLC